ncbi:MAG TPA: hypothetical protein VHG08_16435 [Longimicrobium sp.]|nr:hypothetical protein [Longimicrobium sp.]
MRPGNGGQLVMVLPERGLVVGFTASSYNQYGTWRRLRDELLVRYVIPAIEGGSSTFADGFPAKS